MKIKSGIGFDAHRFAEGRELIVGGILIPYEYGLDGHSDADVLIHAIIDSIVGPSMGVDIGTIFPDTDNSYKGIDSKILLKRAVDMVTEKGYVISNIDAVIIAERPKFKPYISFMREKLGKIIGIEMEDITIKATTTEKMGFTGRREGVAAMSVSCIIKN